MPETLYEVVMEVEERVLLVQGSCQLKLDTPIVTGNTGEKVGGVRGGQREIFCCGGMHFNLLVFYGVGVHEFRIIVVEFLSLQLHVWQSLDREKLKRDLQQLLDQGIRSLAVVLMHSYT